MGLDTYLNAELYVSGFQHRVNTPGYAIYGKLLELMNLTPAELGHDTGTVPSATVKLGIGYWRKANAIHAWFVRHVQNSEDECKPHGVSREKLAELRTTCLEVLAARNTPEANAIADEKLPTRAGFFFGSTEIDEWYWADLHSTVAIIDRCLSPKFEDWDFTYRSSW
jgi:hypothetical protein